ncbi:BON domain-containing protein [Longimicrobium sp.]|uniref:BON domain-containing protein n=1 Tax=Longimicrobium sp. TaxID=2029185 RepID=UPI002CADE1E2|nr:BON domain-containing protein [Longimicrobium sp.]HSU12662.1 BON domain-containing protein [Longimicrobium sp.]
MAHNSRDRNETDLGEALLFALGAAGGLALGVFLSRGGMPAAPEPVRQAGARLRDRARDMAGRWGPANLRRGEEETLQLSGLEDAVIEAFLHDPVLAERGIDVGCISRGIIELSGTVYSADEAERAVRAARGVEGVDTVVNRMDVDEDARRTGRAGESTAWEGHMSGEWTGRNIGMGRRRQGDETDPAGDDSQHLREVALEQSDRAQFEDEELAHSQPRVGSRPGTGDPNPTNYSEDELDNQDPYGKHAVPAPEQPQALNSRSRVGEGLSPGLELEMEAADVPSKPHSAEWQGARPRDADES